MLQSAAELESVKGKPGGAGNSFEFSYKITCIVTLLAYPLFTASHNLSSLESPSPLPQHPGVAKAAWHYDRSDRTNPFLTVPKNEGLVPSETI